MLMVRFVDVLELVRKTQSPFSSRDAVNPQLLELVLLSPILHIRGIFDVTSERAEESGVKMSRLNCFSIIFSLSSESS